MFRLACGGGLLYLRYNAGLASGSLESSEEYRRPLVDTMGRAITAPQRRDGREVARGAGDEPVS